MLTIYHSNQLALLKTLMAELIKRDPLVDPFEPEVVLVQSQGMAQWLQMALAEEIGIAANIQFSLPASYIWQLYMVAIPTLPKESAFSKSAMTWKLMELLSIFSHDERFSEVADYLSGGHQLKKHYQFSAMVADLFDQYLVYRPEWIAAWEKGERISGLGRHQDWQAALWQTLQDHTQQLQQPHWHRANLHQTVLEAFKTGQIDKTRLPQRLFICGIAAFPPAQMQILQALSQHIPVHFLFSNPCRWYWGEIKDQKTHLKLLQRQAIQQVAQAEASTIAQRDWLKAGDVEQENSHPLLASWGKLGRDHLYLLQEIEPKADIDAFVDYEGNNLLECLQQDIYDLHDRSALSAQLHQNSQHKQPISNQDRSVQLHVCHSALREVEVLYDQLLAMLDADPDLQYRHIIVMVADIDHYAPYIQAVFNHQPASRYLPFSISDRTMDTIDPIIRTFLTLLALPQQRCTAEQILSLLEVPAVAQKWGITRDGFELLQHWVQASGIRWGLDDTTALDFDLPAMEKNTWAFGLNRMLLGYAMSSDAGVWQGQLPYDETSGLVAELAGQLADFIEKLQDWRQFLAEEKNLSAWQSVGQSLLETFFDVDTQSEPLLTYIETTWQKVIEEGLTAHFSIPISYEILVDMLDNAFSQSHMSQRFLAGKINFCTLMPMRSIPFDVVCLLGMNDGVYPRMQLPMSFDLMAQDVRRGDRSRRDDDRYLFLEALESAQKILYISYIGYAIQDNSLRYPSVLVSELMDYIAQSYVLAGDENQRPDDSAKSLRHHLTVVHPRMPFDADNFTPATPQQSYAQEWLPAAQRAHTVEPMQMPAVIVEQEISVNRLLQFYRHSVKAFFEQRLHIYFSMKQTVTPEEEPFSLQGLSRYQLEQSILNHLLTLSPESDRTQDAEHLFRQLLASGALPYQGFGRWVFTQSYQSMSELAASIAPYYTQTETLEVNLTLNQMTLQGWLTISADNGILRWRPGELSILDGMRLWIEHLIYAALGHHRVSRMFGRKGTAWLFAPLTTETAQAYLVELLAGYQSGINTPLLLPLKSAWQWLNKAGKLVGSDWQIIPEKAQEAELALLSEWQGGRQKRGEGEDDYYQRFVASLTPAQLAEIQALAQRYLVPLLLHRMDKEEA